MSILKVGPIQQPKRPNPYDLMKDQAKKMKPGEFFEITGILTSESAKSIRSTLCYFSKKQGFKVATKKVGTRMIVEKLSS